jgi:O-antigen/teichoic acid export membrane protein
MADKQDRSLDDPRTLRARTVSGLGWNLATQSATKTLQFAVSVALARLLSPDDFGLIGMVLVLTGFAAAIADLGLGAAIVQREAPSDETLSSAFWLSLGAGGALTIAVILTAPLIAAFYGHVQLRLLTAVMAFSLLLGSLSVVQSALLQKSLDFRKRFRIEGLSISISAVTALALALTGAGVGSLVALSPSETAARAAVMWRLVPWRPGATFNASAAKELLAFGRHLVGFNVVVYWAQNVDKLLIGRQLGSAALGIYSIADRSMRVPLTNVTATTGTVMFPALAALRNDVDAVRRAYLRANRMIAFLTFPMMLGLSVLAEPLVLLIYGEKWRAAVGIVQLLCFAGLAQSAYNTAGWIFLSRGRSDILFRLGLLSMLVRIVGVLIGLHWGLLGVAWGYVAGGYLALLYPTWAAAGRLIELRFAELVKNVAGPFCCATIMAAIVGLSDHTLLATEPYWLRLLVQVPVGVIVYGLCASLFRLTAWREVRELVVEVTAPRLRQVSAIIRERAWR